MSSVGNDPDREYGYDEGLPTQMGGISGVGLPFDLDEEEAERRYLELLDIEARRRPPGFAPWPEP